MLKSTTSLAAAATILATFATTTVQARQITTDTPKVEQTDVQKVVRAQTAQAPCFWLVLGVGY